MILDIQPEHIKKKMGYYSKPDALCNFLRERRKECGYILRKFSVDVGMTPTEFSKLERGEITPTSKEIMNIADKLDVELLKLTRAFAARALGELIDIKELRQ